MLTSWLRNLRQNRFGRRGDSRNHSGRRTPTRRRDRRRRPALELLEDRALPSAAVVGVPAWINRGPNPILDFGANAINNSAVGAIASVGVAHVAVTATNPGGYILYAGTVNGGVWRADNFTEGMLQLKYKDPVHND